MGVNGLGLSKAPKNLANLAVLLRKRRRGAKLFSTCEQGVPAGIISAPTASS